MYYAIEVYINLFKHKFNKNCMHIIIVSASLGIIWVLKVKTAFLCQESKDSFPLSRKVKTAFLCHGK